MFGPILLMTGSICADPVVQPTVTKLAPACASESNLTPIAGDLDSILCCWEAASRQEVRPTGSAREVLRLQMTRDLNGHAAAVGEKLTMAVSAAELKSLFEWRILKQSGKQVSLEATTKDETERLFFSAIHVTLNPSTWRIATLQIKDRAGVVRVDWTSLHAIDQIVQALPNDVLVEGIPPAPQGASKMGAVPIKAAVKSTQRASTVRVSTVSPVAFAEQPNRAERLTPELKEILTRWEAASQNRKTISVTFDRIVYDLDESVEILTTGQLDFESPDKLRMTLRPATLTPHQKGMRINRDGNPFTVRVGAAESWIVSPNQIVITDDDAKTYQVIPWPDEASQGGTDRPTQSVASFIRTDAFLTCVTGIHADQAAEDWALQLKRQTRDSAYLIVRTRTPSVRSHYRECWLHLDLRSLAPTAVKSSDSSGRLETVFKVVTWKENSPVHEQHSLPDLRSYKLVVEAKAAP